MDTICQFHKNYSQILCHCKESFFDGLKMTIFSLISDFWNFCKPFTNLSYFFTKLLGNLLTSNLRILNNIMHDTRLNRCYIWFELHKKKSCLKRMDNIGLTRESFNPRMSCFGKIIGMVDFWNLLLWQIFFCLRNNFFQNLNWILLKGQLVIKKTI